MQMAQRTKVFLFVEGIDVDPFFYGEFAQQVFGDAYGYEIVGAWRLAESGGKSVLLDFHDYLSTTGSLVGTFQGKCSAVLFLLDKDIDDVLNSKVTSDHIVYTQYYSVENYLFLHGDIVKAAAVASSLEQRQLRRSIGDPQEWRRSRAELWRDWVIFAVLAQKRGINHQCNYRLSASTINQPLDSMADAAVVARLRQEFEVESGLPPREFERSYQAVVRMVSATYAQGRHDVLFKGKWYLRLLEAAIERAAAGQPYNTHGIANRLQGAVFSTVNFAAPWAEHFRAPMRALLARVV